MPHPPKNVLVSKEEVGSRLRALRLERGLTQVQLAEILGIDQSNISTIERGHRGLTVHQALKLAKALHVSTDEILAGTKREARDGGLDRRFVRRLERVQSLPRRDQQALLRTIDAFLKSAL